MSTDVEKASGKTQHPFSVTLRKLGVMGYFLNLTKKIYKKPPDIMIFKNEVKKLMFPP